MGRPALIKDEELLAIARQVFLADGISAPTSAIAKLAGVSEAAIFKRYPSKQALFLAALRPAAVGHWTSELEPLAGKGDLRENLVVLAVKMIGFFREVLPRLMLIWAYRRQAPGAHPASAPSRHIERLAEFLADERRRGRLGGGDVDAIARLLVGATFTYAFLETIGAPAPAAQADVYARAFVDALWNGIAPPVPPKKARSRARRER